MFRIKESFEHCIEIEKSRFICYVYRVFSEDEAKQFLQQIKKLHPNATHWCYAFVIGEHNEIQRSNDNGEPSGTAGIPILNSLTKNHMQDTLAIVVRYFGGIKLGAGGLIRAYSKSCSETLHLATHTKIVHSKRYTYQFAYDLIGKIDYFFRQQNIEILDKVYKDTVVYTFLSVDDIHKDLQELSNGSGVLTFLCEELVEVTINKNE
ncbi:MAG: YigZ family protein [Breznakia sp.]